MFGVIGGGGRFGQRYKETLDALNYKWVAANSRFDTDQFNEIWKYCDTVCIVTPPDVHFEYAKKALELGKNVILEKPACSTSQECKTLNEIAIKNSVSCLVNYSYLWHPEYQKIKKECPSAEGYLKFWSVGYGSGPKRNFSALWDWASHDLAMIFDIAPLCSDVFFSATPQKSWKDWNGNFDLTIKWCKNNWASVKCGNEFPEKKRSFSVHSPCKFREFNVDFSIKTLPLMLHEFKTKLDKKQTMNNMNLAIQVTSVLEKITPLV